MSTENTINVSREQFKQVYYIVCQVWKDKLQSTYSKFSFVDNINIPITEIENFLKEADGLQETEIRKILNIEKAEPAAIGDLVLVKGESEWLLRYYAGNMTCFNDQRKTGRVTKWAEIIKFDPNNLPF